jgi:hypothetical protein
MGNKNFKLHIQKKPQITQITQIIKIKKISEICGLKKQGEKNDVIPGTPGFDC